MKRTFLHFALNKRRAFRGRRRSNSDHLAPSEAAGAENNFSLQFTESRHSAISISATDDERVMCTSTHSRGSFRFTESCHSAISIPVTDDDFWQHAQDSVSVSCDNDETIFSLSTASPDSDSLRDHASVLSEDGCCEFDPDHIEHSPVSEPDVGAEGDRFFRSASDAEVLDAASQSVELAVDGSDETIGKPATLMVIPLAVPCVFNIVLQPPPASKGKKSKVKTKKSKADAAATAAQPKPAARTTVMLRHLPRDLSQGELLELLDTKGFQGKYDFVYLPMHFLEQANLGYACVNLISADDVPAFWTAFDGLRKWPKLSTKVLRVGWSSPHQGLQAQVQRYRNSPVMHPSVPEEIQPLLFEDGRRVAFPPPTKTVRAPRVRGAHGEPAFWNA